MWMSLMAKKELHKDPKLAPNLIMESVVRSIVWNHFTILKSESGSKSAELLAIGVIWIQRLMEQNKSVH